MTEGAMMSKQFTAQEAHQRAVIKGLEGDARTEEMLLYLAGRLERPAGVPDGWQLVPIELTEDMYDAGYRVIDNGYLSEVYGAMLAAAPQAERAHCDGSACVHCEPEYGCKPERAAAEVPADERAAFKNFHRALCARFGYTHDEQYWWRDLISLEEFIAAALAQQGEDAKLLPVLRRALQEAIHANAVTLQAAGVGCFDLNVIADMEAAIAQQAAKEGE